MVTLLSDLIYLLVLLLELLLEPLLEPLLDEVLGFISRSNIFQGHFANQDDWCTPIAVDEVENTLQKSNTTHEIFRYDAAHAFFNEQSDAYDVSAQRDAWKRLTTFLEQHL